MNRFTTLLRREWLEHRTSFLWFQLAALATIVLIGLLAVMVGGFADMEIQIQSEGLESAPGFLIDNWSDRRWREYSGIFHQLTTTPFFLIYLGAALFMLLGSLHDERRDRSVLFWKSLPVSDLETVLSKAVLALWVAPVVVILCALLAQIIGLIFLSIIVWSRELGSAWQLWWHAELITGVLQMALGFLIQGLWTLPLAAYLLLVSASVPRMTLLWAIAIPVIPILLEYVLLESRVLATGISKHMEPAALPHVPVDDERIMPAVHTVGDQLALLINPDLWLGVIIGAGLLYAAARVRGINNEL